MIKIMVVDDNALVRRAVCETIDWAAMGCEIEGRLTNGIEGFQYAKEHHPDIIITDIKMPGMDGLEMVKALKEEYDTFSSIVITGFDEFQYAQQALRLGAADILLKPIENKELVETVRRIARGSVEVRYGVGGLKGERNLSGEGKTTGNVSLNGTCSLTEIQILTEMAREEHMQYLEEKKEEHYAIVVRRALAYMRENLSRQITLTELADYAGLSAAHLSRLIKKDTGKSFIDVLNQIRLETAVNLLREGRYKVYEVSNMVGIDNYAYFYQFFKKETGKSPTEYIQNGT